MSIVKIVSPSNKRAASVMSTRLAEDVALCVPANQEGEYREHNPNDEIVPVPMEVKGLVRTRQWILERFGSIFTIDDDVATVRDMLAPLDVKPIYLKPREVTELIYSRAQMAADLGVYLFGFSNVPRPIFVKPMHPFRFTGFMPGHSLGILSGSKLFYHPESGLKDDYWISLLNAYHHRIFLKDMRYWFGQKDTFKNEGGVSGERNMASEARYTEFLRRHFGSEVVKSKIGRTQGGISHEEQVEIHIPW
jgi:hypothetical protein